MRPPIIVLESAVLASVLLATVPAWAAKISFAPYVSEEEAEAIRQYVLLEANRLYRRQQAAASISEQPGS